jgi:hypothetical protein
MGDSRLTWLVDCQRTPCIGAASQLFAASSNARSQLRSALTLLAAKRPHHVLVPPVDMRAFEEYLGMKRYIGLAELEIWTLAYI